MTHVTVFINATHVRTTSSINRTEFVEGHIAGFVILLFKSNPSACRRCFSKESSFLERHLSAEKEIFRLKLPELNTLQKAKQMLGTTQDRQEIPLPRLKLSKYCKKFSKSNKYVQ